MHDRKLPEAVGENAFTNPIAVDDYVMTRAQAQRIAKNPMMLEVLDVWTNEVEIVESPANRGLEALRRSPREQLILAPDRGMLQLSRSAAIAERCNLAAVGKRLNEQPKAGLDRHQPDEEPERQPLLP